MADSRPQRLQIFISDRDLATLSDEADRQHRKASNLAAAIIAEKCKELRSNKNEATVL
jgi:hypothetical protein